jgi:hypothetical protein
MYVRVIGMSKTLSVPLTTSLSPVAHGVLSALAAREDPAGGAANGVISRLLREELDRLAPGAWDELVHRAAKPGSFDPAELNPREVSAHVAERVGALLRARAGR